MSEPTDIDTDEEEFVENTLIQADITINKNMVPFDDKSPFVTSGMRRASRTSIRTTT